MGQNEQYRLGLLQMVLKYEGVLARTLDHKVGGLWDLTSVGEGNETFLVRVWKSLFSERVLKLWGWWRCITEKNGQYLGPEGAGLWDPTPVEEGNETFLIRAWKPLLSRHVLKLWGWWRYTTGQNGQYLLTVNLGGYKYLSRYWAVCQRGHWTSKEGGLWDLISVGERNENIHYKSVETSL